jgi:excisionase family DNA binding protein
MQEEYITVNQVAEILQAHRISIYKLKKSNKIPYYDIPGVGIRFKKEELEQWAKTYSHKNLLSTEILPKSDSSLDISLGKFNKVWLMRRSESMGITRWSYPIGSVLMRETQRKEERYSIQYQVNGQRVRKVLKGIRSRAEAVKVLFTEVADSQRGQYYFQQKNIAFDEMADLYLEKYAKVKKRSWKRSDWVFLRRLKPYFKSTLLTKVTVLMIEEYVAGRKEDGLKNSSVNREISCLRKIFSLAVDWGFLKESPMRRVKNLSEKGSMRERILAEEEEKRLLAEAAPHLKPMIMVGIYTGFRRGVIFNLKWQNVDFEKQEIRITYSKTGTGRTVPMHPIVFNLLYALKSQNGQSEYVFTNPDTSKPYTDISRAFNKACERAGIENLKFHDLRHTFGSRLIKNGANINLVKELMGHASIITTQRYLHSQEDEKRKAIEALTGNSSSMWQTSGKFSESNALTHSNSVS